MPEAPILILLAASAASPGAADVARGPDGGPIILGLSLIQRAALAARRAGYGQVFLLGAKGPPTSGAAVADWRELAATLVHVSAPVIIAPAAILAETDWLERLASTRIEPAAWGRLPHRIVMLAAASAPAAVDGLGLDGGAQDLAAVEGRLARLFGPPAPLSADIAPMLVETRRRRPRRRTAASASRWSRTPTGSWPAMSSDRSRFRSRAAWRELRSRPIR